MTERLRLLVVEQDPVLRGGFLRSIAASSLDAEIVEASTVAEAIAKLHDGTYDCVLVDQELPDRGAFKLTVEIRGDGTPLPIVFLTGLHDEDVLQQAIDSGVTDFYPKSDLSPRRFAFRIKFAIRVAQAEAETARSLAQATAAARARDEVLAIVSHDLRNPLGAIDLSTSMLLHRDAVEPGARKHLEIIRRSTDRMEHLISDLLDMASIEGGRMTFDRQPHDAAQLLRDVLELIGPLATEKGIELVPELDLGGVRLDVDRARIEQVLGNLLGNAIKFCRSGDRIFVRARPEAGQARIAVHDTGPGIRKEDLAHVFEPYWSSRRHTSVGTGLGLYISKGIVEGHGGSVTVASEAGSGATFTVLLPLASP